MAQRMTGGRLLLPEAAPCSALQWWAFDPGHLSRGSCITQALSDKHDGPDEDHHHSAWQLRVRHERLRSTILAERQTNQCWLGCTVCFPCGKRLVPDTQRVEGQRRADNDREH